ncbi:MAG: GTP-binding protein, partial [Gammaproteobacteria bacterium]
MAGYTTQDIRNIALVGHAGAGKTTLVEAILERVGAIKAAGTVERGNTVSDYDPLEKAHQHSLYSTVLGFDYQGKHLNLIDTPGYPDFIGRALSVLPAVETAAIIVNAQTGVQMVTQRMMEWARARELDRLIVINQIDAENVDLLGCLEQIRRIFGDECLPINLPADNGRSVVDCFFDPAGEITDFSSVEEAHTRLIDQVVEIDDALMELYLEQGQSLDPEQLHDPFEKALRVGHLIPVCFVSARTGAGLAELLDILVKL